MTYGDPRAHNYYRNSHDRSSANNPLDTRLSWHWLRDPAGRRPSDDPPSIDESLLGQYRAITPRFGADLTVE